jgi:hypothetical protein
MEGALQGCTIRREFGNKGTRKYGYRGSIEVERYKGTRV